MTKKEMILSMIPAVYHGYCGKEITEALLVYPKHLIEKTVKAGIQIMPVLTSFANASPFIAKNCKDSLSFIESAQGLFVLKEKTVYIKNLTNGAIVHEFAHALDLSIGKEKGFEDYKGNTLYNSMTSYEVNEAFRSGGFVNKYAATKQDEFFAESVRAFLGVDTIPNMPAKKSALKALNPLMYGYLQELFSVKELAKV